jgi:capsid protein
MGVISIFRNGRFSSFNDGAQMDGEKIPGDLSSWAAYTTDPNYIVQSTYNELSKRGSTLYHTNGPVANAVAMNTNYAIGSGLLFRSQPDGEVLGISEKKLKKWAKKFQKLLHYYSQGINYYEKQALIFSGAMQMGDSLVYFVRENDRSFDIVETGGDQIDWSKNEDGKKTLGIIHDQFLRAIGFVDTKGSDVFFRDKNNDQNVIQFYFKEQPRQLRGFPIAYKMINIAKNNDRFWDATTQRAVLESIMFATASTEKISSQRQATALANANKAQKGSGGLTSAVSSLISNIKKLGGGNVFEIKRDDELKFTDLKTPSNNFDKFQDAYIDLAGMSTNTPPEVIKMKYSTSFTAHKGALNDFVISYMKKRRTFERNVAYHYNKEVAKYFILSGMISAPGFFENEIIQRAWLAGNWLGPVPGHINPLQEVNAQIKQVQSGFKKRSDIVARDDVDFDNMIEQWADEEKRFFEASPNRQARAVANGIKNGNGVNNNTTQGDNNND